MTSPNPNEDVTPEPVWDGEGEDPWLPARLQALMDAGTAEQSIYEVVWEALSSWLVTTQRRVMRGPLIDTEAISAQAPAWNRRVEQIIIEGIMPVMAWAYEGIFGAGYDWRERPNVISYLIGVRNRLVGIPDEVFDLVGGQIAAGVTLGEGMPELTERVDEVLSATKSARWKNRAVVIARTESLGALNGSRADAFQAFADEGEEGMERMWLSTIDSRTRPSHVLADGQRVGLGDPFIVGGFPLMFPGDPSGPAGEVIQCVPADTRVELAAVRSVTRRWFEGEMVRISYSTGDVLTITPNHPILRSDGSWTPAGLINEGDYCVHSSFGGKSIRHPNENGAPPEIGEIYRAAREAQTAHRVPLSPPDFHGDGSDGEVEIVAVYGELSFDGEPASEKQIEEFGFTLSHLAGLTYGSGDNWPFPLWVPRGEVDDLAPTLSVGSGSQQATLLAAQALHSEEIGFGCAAKRHTHFRDTPSDDSSAYAKCFCNGEDAFSIEVTLAQVVKVERFDFCGHVFNLDTGVGWYTANGITVRNCRCTTLLLEIGETVDLSRRQLPRR